MFRSKLPTVARTYDHAHRRTDQLKRDGVDYPRRFRASRRGELERRYLSEFGWTVLDGPFAGMRYPRHIAPWLSDLSGKLSGAYEAGLHDLIERAIAWRPDRVIDVGAAEGYYAIGLAYRLPAAQVIASDIDPIARLLSRPLAWANGVSRQMRWRGAFTPAMVPSGGRRCLFFFDCEGAERELCDPALVPALQSALVIVELHDFVYRDIGDVLLGRFEPTHDVEIITQRAWVPERFASWNTADVELLLDERRPEPMRWAAFFPRASRACSAPGKG